MATGVSVLICCYNSAARLPATLKHLFAQHVTANIPWEIIVVDNASNDNTADVARQTLSDFGDKNICFKILSEHEAGKNNALHTGVMASAYDCILICDDDNWLNENYVDKAYHRIQGDNTIGAAGGQGFAATEGELPDWFNQYKHGYAVGEQNPGTGDVSEKKYLWGAGMIFRKALYVKAYADCPSFLTGPNAESLARGEDVEFCMRILMAGYKLFYDEALVYQHYIPAARLTTAYRDKLFNGYDYEKQVLDLYSRQIQINKLSWPGKRALLLAGISRFLLSGISGKWNRSFEAGIIYLISGYQFSTVSNQIKKLRALNLQLANPQSANA